jgi:hypothetical protein
MKMKERDIRVKWRGDGLQATALPATVEVVLS